MILFSGCSITWGDELENRKKDRFSKNHVNIARNGLSNDMIVMRTIEYIEQNHDVDYVITQFTVPRRSTYWENEYKNITPWTDNTQSRVFYKYLDSQEMRMMNLWKNVYVLDQYLRDIPHYFWRLSEGAEKTSSNDSIFKKLVPWSDILITHHPQGVVPNSLYH